MNADLCIHEVLGTMQTHHTSGYKRVHFKAVDDAQGFLCEAIWARFQSALSQPISNLQSPMSRLLVAAVFVCPAWAGNDGNGALSAATAASMVTLLIGMGTLVAANLWLKKKSSAKLQLQAEPEKEDTCFSATLWNQFVSTFCLACCFCLIWQPWWEVL